MAGGFLSTSFLLLHNQILPVRGEAGTFPRGNCPSRSGRNCLEDLEDQEIVRETKNLTQPGGQVRTFLQADRGRCASVKGLQYLYIYAMIWTQVPSRSLAWEAKRLTQPGGLVRLRRLTDRGRWSSGISFFLLAYRPHRKLLLGRGTFGVTGAWSSLALQPQRLLDRSTALGGDRSRCGDFARGAEHLGTPDEAWCSRLPTSREG